MITVQKLFTKHGTITRDVDSGDSVFEIYVKVNYPQFHSITGTNGIDVDIIRSENQGDISLADLFTIIFNRETVLKRNYGIVKSELKRFLVHTPSDVDLIFWQIEEYYHYKFQQSVMSRNTLFIEIMEVFRSYTSYLLNNNESEIIDTVEAGTHLKNLLSENIKEMFRIFLHHNSITFDFKVYEQYPREEDEGYCLWRRYSEVFQDIE